MILSDSGSPDALDRTRPCGEEVRPPTRLHCAAVAFGAVVLLVSLAACDDSDESVGADCEDAVPIESCTRGAAFADCGGDGEPSLACSSPGVCLWFAGGCPALDYTPSDECPSGQCVSPRAGWGADPWDADRAMVMSVTVDAEASPVEAALECTCETPDERGCVPGLIACDPRFEEPIVQDETWGSGLVVAILDVRSEDGAIRVEDGERVSFSAQARVFLEVDRGERPRARVCVVQMSDAPVNDVPLCASGGAVVIHPTELHASFEAQFDDGVTIRGAF